MEEQEDGVCVYLSGVLHQKAGGAGNHHFESAMGRGAFLLGGAEGEWKEKAVMCQTAEGEGKTVRNG